MKAIILTRVSTEEQELKQQQLDCINFAHNLGYSDDNIILISNKESGVKLSFKERMGIQDMISAIEKDSSINLVIVWSLNRLGRNPTVLYEVKDFLTKRKINLKTLDGLNLLNEDGSENSAANWVFSVMATMSAEDAREIKKKFDRGKRQSIALGKIAHSTAMFGYKVDENNYIKIDNNQKCVVEEIFNRYANTTDSALKIGTDLYERGLINIANNKNNLSQFVRNIIKNKAYSGRQGKAKKYVKKYPAIVSAELQDKAIEQLDIKRSKPKSNQKHIYLCKGLIRCYCGSILTGHYQSKLYYCKGCGMEISMRNIDYITWQMAIQLYSIYLLNISDAHKAELHQQLSIEKERIAAANTNINKLTKKYERLNDLYIDGALSKEQYDDKKQLLDNDRKGYSDIIIKSNDSINAIKLSLKDISSSKVNIDDIANITDKQQQFDIIHKVLKEIRIQKINDDRKILRIDFINVFDISSPYYYIYNKSHSPKIIITQIGTSTGNEEEITIPK